uniref:Uncharacterized protein n=1 Tax=Arundo donax TaxID=35708 RepID=A0A0A9DPP2_ARUDO
MATMGNDEHRAVACRARLGDVLRLSAIGEQRA